MRAALGRQFGGLPRAFWVLWTATLVNRIGGFVVILLAIYLTQQRGFDPAMVGLALGLAGGGNALGSVIGGHLADVWGRRGILLIGHITSAAAMVAMAYVREPVLVIIVAGLLGIAQGLPRPAFGAMVIDIVEPADRLRALNLNYWILNLGFAIAALLGGVLATFDFTLIFLIDAVTTLVAGLLIWVLVPETRPERHPDANDDDARVNPYRDRVFVGLLTFMLLTSIVFGQVDSMMPITMVDRGLSPALYGAVISINGIMIVAGQLFVPRLTNRYDHSAMLAVAAVFYGLGVGVFAFAFGAPMFAFGVVLLTVGEMIMTPPFMTVVAELSPLHGRGRYQGAMSLSRGLASLVAPIVGGVVYQLHPSALWLGALVVSVAAAWLVAGMRDALKQRAAELATQT